MFARRLVAPARAAGVQRPMAARALAVKASSGKLHRRDSDLLLARRGSVLDQVHADRDHLAEMLTQRQQQATANIVPWFLREMPDQYFQQVPEDLRNQHLRALSALQEGGFLPDATLTNDEGTVTLIRPLNKPGQLLDMLSTLDQLRESLKIKNELSSMQVYLSKDQTLTLNVFQFHSRLPGQTTQVPQSLLDYAAEVQSGSFKGDDLHAQPAPYFFPEAIRKHVAQCSPDYVSNSSARRFCLQMAMHHHVTEGGADSEAVAIEVENNWAMRQGDSMLTLALTNVAPIAALSRVSKMLSSRGVDIVRVNLDVIKCQPDVTMLRVLTSPFTQPTSGKTTSWADLPTSAAPELARAAKWLDDRVLDLYATPGQPDALTSRSLLAAETTVAMSDLVHALLSPADAYQYARARVLWVLTSPGPARDCAEEIVFALCARMSKQFAAQYARGPSASFADLRARINAQVELANQRAILEKLQDVCEGVLATNMDNQARFALSFKLSPAKSMPPSAGGEAREPPFGVFFIHGRRFAAFHVRFRDIARGGLRVVTPPTEELRGFVTSQHFNECYDLAFAQQLKNKDIAEGGAKAVIVCDCVGLDKPAAHRAVRRAVRAFTDSMLDLLAPHSSEIVYLGPDEQILPEDIKWIAERSVRRGYPLGPVFISSKADAGINHKQYGVTSEGVNVFLRAALETAGLEPTRRPFTVKITGGPDGDVAGNMLRILRRDYGDNCRVVGLCDATAAAEDPDGIAWPELERLVRESRPLAELNAVAAIGGKGRFGLATEREGLLMRNTMHMRVKADAFVPAGGRPGSINANNVRAFLQADGTPSSRIIVEGANLFLTAQARKILSLESKCLIVKDSSANKCGVVTSSYEVLGGMLVSKDQFVAVKDAYVHQVLNRLRYVAAQEATYLMREWRAGRAPVLPEACVEVSRSILKLADAVHVLPHNDSMVEWVASQLPIDPLVDALGHRGSKGELLKAKLPPAYLASLVAKVVASECVYREGPAYFAEGDVGGKAEDYVHAVLEVDGVAKQMEAKGESHIAKVLRLAAPRTLIDHGVKKVSELV